MVKKEKKKGKGNRKRRALEPLSFFFHPASIFTDRRINVLLYREFNSRLVSLVYGDLHTKYKRSFKAYYTTERTRSAAIAWSD